LRRPIPFLCALALAASVAVPSVASGVEPRATRVGAADWPTYGHDTNHSFHGRTTLTPTSVRTLAPAWFFPTGDAVTANPVVVAGTVYVGSWDGNFYALDARTGAERWRFAIRPQPAISPQPGGFPRDVTSDGGLITSSAW